MAAFESSMARSNQRQLLVMILVPLLVIGAVVYLYFQDNPGSTFKNYQSAIRAQDWQTVIQLSDQNTRAYLGSLDEWVWTGKLADMESLDPFQQFLIFTTRCRILGDSLARPESDEMLRIWMEALSLDSTVVRSKVINRYHFGESAIGQLFLEHRNASTGLKVHFIKEAQWRLESMTLLKEAYEQAALEGNHKLLRRANPNYFLGGLSNQHLMPLRMQFEENL